MNPPHHIILMELNFSGPNPILAFLNEIVHWCMHASVAKKRHFLSKLLDIITFRKLLLLRNKIIMTWKIFIEYTWTMMKSILIKTHHTMKVLLRFDFKRLSPVPFRLLLTRKLMRITIGKRHWWSRYFPTITFWSHLFSYNNFLETSFFLLQ